MNDAWKTKAQLLEEVAELRQQLAAWQVSEARREHRQAEQALAERIRQAEAVQAITAEITRELNLTTLLGLITQRAVALVEAATSGVVYLWDTAAEVLTTQAWHGRGEWMREVRLRLGEGIAGTVAQRREGLLVNDYRTSPYVNPLFMECLGSTAVLAEPLLYRERLVGVIAISNEDTGRLFTAQGPRAPGPLRRPGSRGYRERPAL
jgi:signal transduction protein with GAF and PtsI domain